MQGHVDGVGTIVARAPGGGWENVTVALPPDLARYVVEKGSITVDGVSLTVTDVTDSQFSVSLIPTTLKLTTLGRKDVGAPGEPGGRRDRQVRGEARGRRPAMTDLESTPFSTIEEAVKEIAAGRPVVVVDDEDRENEGDLIFAAELATPELIAFMVRYTSGFICAPLTEADADRLELPPMYHDQPGPAGHRVHGDGGRPRGRHHRHLGGRAGAHDPAAGRPGDQRRPTSPGPVTWCRCGPARAACCAGPGHTEAAVDLARLAGLRPAGVLCELVNDDGTMMRLPELRALRRRARAVP